ncbi:uncharacterized protein J3R85_005366 [Psidium guajava]|nr:uncharacterized protein J3R85_005366 [Psidium guajava]
MNSKSGLLFHNYHCNTTINISIEEINALDVRNPCPYSREGFHAVGWTLLLENYRFKLNLLLQQLLVSQPRGHPQ